MIWNYCQNTFGHGWIYCKPSKPGLGKKKAPNTFLANFRIGEIQDFYYWIGLCSYWRLSGWGRSHSVLKGIAQSFTQNGEKISAGAGIVKSERVGKVCFLSFPKTINRTLKLCWTVWHPPLKSLYLKQLIRHECLMVAVQ